jgi:hypothetical protein
MKKYLVAVVLAILLATGMQAEAARLFNGEHTSQPSIDYAASALVATGPCVLRGIVVKTDGTNAVTITIYDSTTAAGKTVVFPASSVIPGTSYLFSASSTPPTYMDNGIYVLMSIAGGGSATFKVEYDQ